MDQHASTLTVAELAAAMGCVESLRVWRDFESPRSPREQGFVYFVGPEQEYGPVKIGWARNPRDRLGELQVGNAQKLILVARVFGDRCDEKWLHKRFQHLRRQGEWFLLEPDLQRVLRILGAARSVFETPSHVAVPLPADAETHYAWFMEP